jgi:hypothetical protein
MGAALALLTLAARPAPAATILSGHHDNNPNPPADNDGYDALGPGEFVVPADTGSTPSATFNDNTDEGLYANGATITIHGGQFNNNTEGLYALYSDVTITGGTFNDADANGAAVYVYQHTLSISGGTFDNGYGIFTHYAAVTLTGGQFDNAITDFYVYSGNTSFDVYGQFDGLTLGQTQSLAVTGQLQSFTGTLQNESTAHTFTYKGTGGAITLHDVPLPEPTSASLLGGLFLFGWMRGPRKRLPIATQK